MTYYWLSRQPKYTAEETFRIGFHYVLRSEITESLKCLQLAADQGHDEAIFLLIHFKTHGSGYASRHIDAKRRRFLKMSFDDNPHPRAFKYSVWFSPIRSSFNISQYGLLAGLVDTEEPLIQYVIAKAHEKLQDWETAIEWHRKAAARDFPHSMYRLSILLNKGKKSMGEYTEESGRLLLRAIQLGHSLATTDVIGMATGRRHRPNVWMNWLITFDKLEVTKLDARQSMLKTFRHGWTMLNELKDPRTLITFAERDEEIVLHFVIGQEYDEYDTYYPDVQNAVEQLIRPIVGLYRQMTSRARQVAVYTIMALRSLGVVKDIAILIAKLVYQSRVEVVWYEAAD